MKMLSEMEAQCQRILALLENDGLDSTNQATLLATLARLRNDLDQQLATRRATGTDTPELRSADDALQTMTADVLWLQEYAAVRPIMAVSQKLRMASWRALRIVSLLQVISEEAALGRTPSQHPPLAAGS